MILLDQINEIKGSLQNMLEIDDLSQLGFLYKDYDTITNKIDFYDKNIYKQYKSLIRDNLKSHIRSQRIVYSIRPSIVCSLPTYRLYHRICHPLHLGVLSVFVSFTPWYSFNTIEINNDKNKTKLERSNSITVIRDDQKISIPQHTNISKNSSFGIYFFIMSWQTFKNNNTLELNRIGDQFGLI